MTGYITPPALPISLTLTAIVKPAEDGWIHAHLPAIPGVVTCARSEKDVPAMLADALRQYLLSLEEDPSSERLQTAAVTLTFT